MPDRMIVNASPLIFHSRVGGLTWLCDLSAERLMVPRAVIGEVAAGLMVGSSAMPSRQGRAFD
jgi:hypothetical protein